MSYTLAVRIPRALALAKRHPLDRESLVALLRGEIQRLDRPAIFWHFPGYSGRTITPVSSIDRRHAGRRCEQVWSYETERQSLYDLTDDLGEARDLLAGVPRAEHREAAQRLSRDLCNWTLGLRVPRAWVRARNVPVKPPPQFESVAGNG